MDFRQPLQCWTASDCLGPPPCHQYPLFSTKIVLQEFAHLMWHSKLFCALVSLSYHIIFILSSTTKTGGDGVLGDGSRNRMVLGAPSLTPARQRHRAIYGRCSWGRSSSHLRQTPVCLSRPFQDPRCSPLMGKDLEKVVQTSPTPLLSGRIPLLLRHPSPAVENIQRNDYH